MKRKKCFTLVELLIVIAIIAILASLLLPALQKAKQKSLSANCLANLKQIGVAAISYANDQDGWICAARTGNTSTGLIYWNMLFSDGKYITNEKVYTCPGGRYAKAYSRGSDVSYGMCNNFSRDIRDGSKMESVNIFKHTKARQPSLCWYFGDSLGTIGWGQLRQSFALAWFNGSNIYFSLRHTGTGQLWFLDGSARAVQERVAKNRVYTYPYFEQVYIDDLYLK